MNLIKSRVRTTSRTLDLYPCHCFLVTTIRNWVLDSLDTPRVSHVCTWFLWLSKDSGVQELRPDHPANWTMKNYEILDRPAESTPRLRPWNVVSTRCPAWINDDSCMLFIYILYNGLHKLLCSLYRLDRFFCVFLSHSLRVFFPFYLFFTNGDSCAYNIYNGPDVTCA